MSEITVILFSRDVLDRSKKENSTDQFEDGQRILELRVILFGQEWALNSCLHHLPGVLLEQTVLII